MFWSALRWRFFASLLLLSCTPVFADWSYLGPDNIGGRTRTLIIHPTNPNILYTATYGGGVWKSVDAGATWQPIGDSFPNLAIGALAMDPSNPDTLYAGVTGASGPTTTGIFKTTDGGSNWTHLTNNFSPTGPIIVSPLDPLRIYVVAGPAVMRTIDGGATWSQVLSDSRGCQDLVMRTDQPNDYLFASCGALDIGVTIYRNTAADIGDTWSSPKSVNRVSRASLAIAPSNQSTIYAIITNFDRENLDFHEGLHSVWQSTDSGDSWNNDPPHSNTFSTSELNNMLLSDAHLALCGATMRNHGLYSNALAVDPVNADRVWVGGIDLFRSDDGGATWGLAAHSSAPSSNPRFSHADTHDIVFHPDYDGSTNKTLYVVNDQGVFRTDDATGTVTTDPCNYDSGGINWTPLISGYGATEFQHGLPYPDGTTYLGGTRGNGTIRGSDGGGVAAWEQLLGSEGGYVAINPNNTSILYAENQGISIQKSIDGGASFSSSTSGISDIGLSVTPFMMDPANPLTLWTGGAIHWRSDNGGDSWTLASLNNSDKRTTCVAVSPLNSNRVVVGRENGKAMWTDSGLTANASTQWTEVNKRTGVISSFAFDPQDDNIAYATYSSVSTQPNNGEIYRITNAGSANTKGNWVEIDGDLPNIPVQSILVNPIDSNTLYIGTRLGVYSTTNGGTNWVKEGIGLPEVSVKHLELLTAGGHLLLFAFTEGRGLWKLDLGTIPTPPSVSITSPSDGDILSGTVNVDATASDDTSVSQLEFYLDGNLLDTDMSDPYSISWNTTTASNGHHTLVARAYDNENNTTDSTPVPVVVVNGAPFVEITTPAENATVGGMVMITADAYDDAGVTQVEFYYDGNQLIDTDFTAPYSVSWDVSLFENGSHTLTAVAFDADMNDMTSMPVTVNVSNGLYFDDFENDFIGWTFTKGSWSVINGDLTGTFNKKADIISDDFTALGGCSLCAIETYMRVDTAGGRASLLAFYVSKNTMVELVLMDDKNKLLLKQRSNGTTVAKEKGLATITPGVDYKVRLEHDGSKFIVFLNDTFLFEVNRGAAPAGTVGYRVKSTTGANATCAFKEIRVE